MNIKYEWNPEKGLALADIYINDKVFRGSAVCAPEDQDVMSEFTGCTLALMRAQLNAYIDERDNILKPSLKALKQLYYSMNRSKNYNKKSYEARRLWRHIRMYKEDIEYINETIEKQKSMIMNYIQDKEIFHTRLRKVREKEQNLE